MCVGIVGLMLASARSASADVTIEGSDDQHLVVDARNATVQEIISKISEGRDFTVERGDVASQDPRITSRFEGPVAHILDRVLEQENNVVVRDAGPPGRIARIVLYGPHRDKVLQPDSAPATAAPARRANLVKIDATRLATGASSARNAFNGKRRLRQPARTRPLHAEASATAQKKN